MMHIIITDSKHSQVFRPLTDILYYEITWWRAESYSTVEICSMREL